MFLNGPMVGNTKGSSRLIKEVAKGNSFGRMVGYTMACGWMENSMAMAA